MQVVALDLETRIGGNLNDQVQISILPIRSWRAATRDSHLRPGFGPSRDFHFESAGTHLNRALRSLVGLIEADGDRLLIYLGPADLPVSASRTRARSLAGAAHSSQAAEDLRKEV